MIPAVVISTYNRPHSLERLLAAVRSAHYPAKTDVPLVISIDLGQKEHDSHVRAIAEHFDWPFGYKRVIYQPEHLGVERHYFCCGELTQAYEAIIYLEDDLFVSPVYYYFASQALSYYESDDRIAGVCLYSLWFNGYTQQPFVPLMDDSDAFFLQIPYTQGQAFTRSQWQPFSAWLASGDRRPVAGDPIHSMFLKFAADDWFPVRTKYLVIEDKFFVFPRESFSTGFGEAGAHFAQASTYFQTPLQRFRRSFQFKGLDESPSVYDSFYEILPDRLDRLTNRLHGISYDVDMYGTKSLSNYHHENVLTSRACSSPRLTFGKVMWPPEVNVIEGVPGSEIVLCRQQDLKWGRLADLELQKGHYDFFTRRRPPGKKRLAQYWMLDLMQGLKAKLKKLTAAIHRM